MTGLHVCVSSSLDCLCSGTGFCVYIMHKSLTHVREAELDFKIEKIHEPGDIFMDRDQMKMDSYSKRQSVSSFGAFQGQRELQ